MLAEIENGLVILIFIRAETFVVVFVCPPSI